MLIDDAELDAILNECMTERELDLEERLIEVDRRLDAISVHLADLVDVLIGLLEKVDNGSRPQDS